MEFQGLAMFGKLGDTFRECNLCPTVIDYEFFIEEVLKLRDADETIKDAMEHYLGHVFYALMCLKDLFKGTRAGRIFGILSEVNREELLFIQTGDLESFREMVRKLKRITLMCCNCIHSEPIEGTSDVRCIRDEEEHSLDYWCEHFIPRLD